MAAQRSPAFQGRSSELDQLGRVLTKVRAGESAALVVRGEAGVGKTALLDHFVGRASGFQVVRIAGVESEIELPFAGLHQLCAPLLDELERLPDPQQNALRVAFGLMSGETPDRFLVGLATLSLLAEVALKGPLVCVVDDTQWLDSASRQVFGFVARRLLAESVLMLFSIRDPSEDPHFAGLPQLRLDGLSDADALLLLVAAVPGRVDAQVRERIVAEARGNPLALLELPRRMTAAELAGGFPVPASNDLPAQLEEHYLRRLEALPKATQRLMLVAAAEPTGDVALLWRAAETLEIERHAAAGADTERLVEIGTRVRFRHPLVRSAIYAGASVEDRRTAHLSLAEAMDPRTDPDRRAWHRALAAAGPDEEIASELEQSASRAQSRGGLAAAAALLQRSVTLTGDAERRIGRSLAAAHAQVHAGAFDDALRLLAGAEIDASTELQRARIDFLRGQIALAAGPVRDAPRQLLKAAQRLELLDVNLAREIYLDAWGAAMFAAQPGNTGQLRDVSNAARAAPAPPGSPRLPDLLLDGLSLLFSEGLASATPALRKAVSAFLDQELSIDKGLQWGALAAAAAGTLWDFESMGAVLSRQSELARNAGALAPLCFTLTGEVFVLAWRGELAAAAALADEADVLVDAIGIHQVPMGPILLAALKGEEPHSSTFIHAGIDLANARGEGTAAQVGYWAAAALANGLSHYEQAMSQALKACSGPTHHLDGWALPELIEAAVRSGHDTVAADALERLTESTKRSDTEWARGVLARSEALTGDRKATEENYRASIDCFSKSPLRPEQARSHLLYGEWLRRQKRRMDARGQLRSAHEMFCDIGMTGFANRALHELMATGATVRKRRDDTRGVLTSQEELIARLALEGRTNPEIGAQLYLSARTVEWHLRKVFAKLGIASRKELRDALPARVVLASGR